MSGVDLEIYDAIVNEIQEKSDPNSKGKSKTNLIEAIFTDDINLFNHFELNGVAFILAINTSTNDVYYIVDNETGKSIDVDMSIKEFTGNDLKRKIEELLALEVVES